MLCLLVTIILAATTTKSAKTYTNPVLVETILLKKVATSSDLGTAL